MMGSVGLRHSVQLYSCIAIQLMANFTELLKPCCHDVTLRNVARETSSRPTRRRSVRWRAL